MSGRSGGNEWELRESDCLVGEGMRNGFKGGREIVYIDETCWNGEKVMRGGIVFFSSRKWWVNCIWSSSGLDRLSCDNSRYFECVHNSFSAEPRMGIRHFDDFRKRWQYYGHGIPFPGAIVLRRTDTVSSRLSKLVGTLEWVKVEIHRTGEIWLKGLKTNTQCSCPQ